MRGNNTICRLLDILGMLTSVNNIIPEEFFFKFVLFSLYIYLSLLVKDKTLNIFPNYE